MGKDAHPFLQHQDDIRTQRVLQEVGGALFAAGGGVGHHDDGGRWLGGQEGRLQQRPLHVAEVGLPELQVPAGNERCPDGVVKDVLDAKLGHHTGLIVGDAQLLGHFPTLLWGKDFIGLDGPSQGSPGPIDSLQVSITQVQLATHQDDRCSGAEVLDFWVPHGLDMVEGVGVGNGEAQNHHIRSPISKATVFVVISEGVPEAEGHADIIYYVSGTFQHLLAHPILVDGPNSGHVGGEQLVLGEGGIAGPGTNEPGFAHGVVPHHHALDGLY